MVATYVDEKRTIGSRVLCQKNKWKSFLDNAIEAKSKKGVLKFFGCAVIVFTKVWPKILPLKFLSLE